MPIEALKRGTANEIRADRVPTRFQVGVVVVNLFGWEVVVDTNQMRVDVTVICQAEEFDFRMLL
jgi:hypothetical protein